MTTRPLPRPTIKALPRLTAPSHEALIARRQRRTRPGAIAIAARHSPPAARPRSGSPRCWRTFSPRPGQYEAAEFHFRWLVEDDPGPANRARNTAPALRRIAPLKAFRLFSRGPSFRPFVPSTKHFNRGTVGDIVSVWISAISS